MKAIVMLLLLVTPLFVSAEIGDNISIAFIDNKQEVKDIYYEQNFIQKLGTNTIDTSLLKVRPSEITDVPFIVDFYNEGMNEKVWCDTPYTYSAWTMTKEYFGLLNQYGAGNVFMSTGEYEGVPVSFAMGMIVNNQSLLMKVVLFNTSIDQSQWEEINQKTIDLIIDECISKGYDDVIVHPVTGTWMTSFIEKVFGCQQIGNTDWSCSLSGYKSRRNKGEIPAEEIIYTPPQKTTTVTERPTRSLTSNNKVLRRDTYSTTYELPNGKRNLIISSRPINYETSNGWEEITSNTTFMEKQGGVMKQKYLNVTFNGSSEKELLVYSNDGITISQSQPTIEYHDSKQSITLERTKSSTDNNSKILAYIDVFDNMTLAYNIEMDRIKEAIIIYSPPKITNPDIDNGTIVFKTTITSNVVPEKSNGLIMFGTVKVERPMITDSEGRKELLDYGLKEIDKETYELSANITYGWLVSSEKKYPLIFDPTISVGATADASINRTSPDLVVASVFKFNISSIPSSVTINSARLYLTGASNNSYSESIGFMRLDNQVWDESGGDFTDASKLSWINVFTGKAKDGELIDVDVTGNATTGIISDYNANNDFFTVQTITFFNTTYNQSSTSTFSNLYAQTDTTLCLVVGSKGCETSVYTRESGTSPPALNITYTEQITTIKSFIIDGLKVILRGANIRI